MTIPELFISFSSKDVSYVRELMAALHLQGCLFWDYSSQIEAIEAGADIPQTLFEHIDACNFFIILVSNNSIDPQIGRFTTLEAAYAQKIGKKIIPITLKENRPSVWPEPFAQLKDIRHIELEVDDDRAFIACIIKLCQAVGKPFDPFAEAHERLPFWRFFREEVRQLEHSNADHVRLTEILGRFNRRFRHSDWSESLFLIAFFMDSCRYLAPDYRPYYPWIVKAVCQRELGLLDEAEASYRRAGEVRPADENVYGGLAGVCFQRGDLKQAIVYARRAVEVCPPDRNSDEILNLTIYLLADGKTVPEPFAERVFALDDAAYGADRFKVLNAQGALYFARGRHVDACYIFEKMERGKIADAATVGYHVNSLLALGKRAEAIHLLKAILAENNDDRIDRAIVKKYLASL
jgi:hypothetical protein